MQRRRIFRFALAWTATTLAANAAHAEWAEAETDHLVVYSEKSPEEAARLAIELERFDEAMRYMLRIGGKESSLPRSAKLTIFQFGDTNDIEQLHGTRDVAGFFIPRAGDSVAFVPVREAVERGSLASRMDSRNALDARTVMYHEYAHYFMYQHAAAAYPAWYREGFAEVYGTLQLTDNGFIFGAPAKHRSDTLTYLATFHVKRLLDPPTKLQFEDVLQWYAMGWMLCHYLTFSPDRKDQLGRYFQLINEGKSNLEAAEGAFGDLDKLNSDLDVYQRGKFYGLTITHKDYSPPSPTVRVLSEDEAAIMPLRIKTTRGVEENKAGRIVDPVRSIAARYPTSAAVLLELAEAELDAKSYDAAESAAKKVLTIDPSNAKAYIYLGRIAMQRSKEDPAQFAVARSAYAQAIRLDRRNPDPLLGYYLSFRLAGVEPPEDSLVGLEMAYDFAPFDPAVRTTLAHLLLTENRGRDAIAVLGPIAADVHGGKFAKRIAGIVDNIRDGEIATALAGLAPSVDGPIDEGEEDDS